MIIFKPHQVFEHLEKYLSPAPVIVEAGAFNGTDTIRMIGRWPKAVIHAFEPVPQLFQKLVQATKQYPTIHCYPYALSDTDGTASLYVSEKPSKPGVPSQASSLLKPKDRLHYSPLTFPHTISVETITLDSWAQRYRISTIDLLWLDLQGHELSVLKAAPHTLSMVQAIYTEVGFVEGYENQPRYAVVKRWLEEQGFVEVGRDFQDETSWFFGNVLMVRESTLAPSPR